MSKLRLLIGSAICQSPRILGKFLQSLKNLELSDYDVAFKFIDDNKFTESKEILKNAELGPKIILTDAPEREENYHIDEITHYWNNSLVMRVAKLKNEIINYAIEENYDYLFLIDSDLVVDPNLINHLISQGKDIISEIFWTAWQPGTIPLPNVWMYDSYEMAHPALEENERRAEQAKFLNQLYIPGVYEVGGLGACTLISVLVLKKGLNFSPIKNISFWGEDRWFCIRASALGIDLYVDTQYPANHMYRESDIAEG
jgi:hypothetical protein